MDNALAESFVDSYKTELISDRVWRSHAQLELASVEYVGWFNHARLHSSLGNVPPAEYEASWRAALATTATNVLSSPPVSLTAQRSPSLSNALCTTPSGSSLTYGRRQSHLLDILTCPY